MTTPRRQPGFWLPRFAPMVAAEVDWLHPLSVGLVACFCMSQGPKDLTGHFPTLGPAATTDQIVGSASGPGLRATVTGATTGLYADTSTWDTVCSSAISCFWYGDGISAPTNGKTLVGFIANNTGVTPFGAYVATANGGVIQGVVDTQADTSVSLSTGGTPFVGAGDHRSACMTWRSGGNLSVYANGVSGVAAISGGASTLKAYATSRVSFMHFPGAAAGTNNARGVAGMIWNRELSASEILRLHYDPFCVLRPVKQRRYATPAAITAAQQAFAVVAA